jgi:hypothetical protein
MVGSVTTGISSWGVERGSENRLMFGKSESEKAQECKENMDRAIKSITERGKTPNPPAIERTIEKHQRQDHEKAISREGNAAGLAVGALMSVAGGPALGLTVGMLTATAVKTVRRWIDAKEQRAEEEKELYGK